MARPTKLNDEVEKIICDAIREGVSYEAAAGAAGVALSTFNEWMKDERPSFRRFSEAVLRANSEARIVLEKRVRDASRKDWRAGAWILERRFPNDFSNKSSVDVTTAGNPLPAAVVNVYLPDNGRDKPE